MTHPPFDLTPYNITRPEKIIWRFQLQNQDVLQSIVSKSLRSFLSHTDTVLAEQQIKYEYRPVDRNEFQVWLEFYEKQMVANDYDTLANLDWFDKKIAANKQVEGLFFYRDGQLIGSAIISRDGQTKATMAFKASQRVDISNHKNASFGALIDYLFLVEMVKQKVGIISGGRSRNAFGVINKVGYIEYKLRLGYQPIFDPTVVQHSDIPLSEDGSAIFFSPNAEQQMTAYIVGPTDHPIFATITAMIRNIPIQSIVYTK
jgi:hypothetical protein